MSLEINLTDVVTEIATEFKATRNLINGNAADLTALTTSAKTSLVAAINELQSEVNSAAGGGVAINDAAITTTDTWSSSKISTTIDSDVSAAVTALVNGAPGTLDTLNELATALTDNDADINGILTAQALRVRVDAPQAFDSTQQAQARSNIGAGTSDLTIGTTGTTAKAGNYQPTAANISDATTVGRNVLTAATDVAARTAIGAGTSSLVIGTTASTAAAGNRAATESAIGMVELATTTEASTGTDTVRAVTPAGLKVVADTKAATVHTHTALQISDATTIGRTILTAADAATVRSTIGAASATAVGNTEADLVAIFQAALV